MSIYPHGTTLNRCLRVCNTDLPHWYGRVDNGFKPTIEGTSVIFRPSTVNMPPNIGQESDINSALNAVILIRTTGSVLLIRLDSL